MDRHIIRRLIVFIIAMNIMTLGIILSTKAVLGASPISSVPNVLSLGTPLTIGTATFILNALLLAAGALIMRRDFKLSYLSSLVMVVIFSVLCDVYAELLSFICPTEYWQQWALTVCSAVILALGLSLEISANITMLPGDYLVSFISFKTGAEFGKVKVCFDVLMISAAVLLSFTFFGIGSFIGVREGTIFAAICVGIIIRFFTGILKKGFYEWIGYMGITARDR